MLMKTRKIHTIRENVDYSDGGVVCTDVKLEYHGGKRH